MQFRQQTLHKQRCRCPAERAEKLQSRLYRRASCTKGCLPQTGPSFTICSQAARRPRRAVMWFQCLGPCGTLPSGGKPLRPCCHISPPIISSGSALWVPPHFPSPLPPEPHPHPLPLPALICYRLLHPCSPTASSLLIFCLNNQPLLLTSCRVLMVSTIHKGKRDWKFGPDGSNYNMAGIERMLYVGRDGVRTMGRVSLIAPGEKIEVWMSNHW